MKISYDTALIILACVFANGHLTGQYFQGNNGDSQGRKIGMYMMTILLGFALIVISNGINYVEKITTWINDKFLIRFWYRIRFTIFYESLTDDDFSEMIERSRKRYEYLREIRHPLKITNRIFIRGLKVLRKKRPGKYFDWMDDETLITRK